MDLRDTIFLCSDSDQSLPTYFKPYSAFFNLATVLPLSRLDTNQVSRDPRPLLARFLKNVELRFLVGFEIRWVYRHTVPEPAMFSLKPILIINLTSSSQLGR